MPTKSQQIERDQSHGQEIFAVTEIVFEFVAVILQHIESLVLNLPTSPGTSDDFSHVPFVQWQTGHPGRSICDPAFVIDNPALDPVDEDGIFTAAQWNALDPTVEVRVGLFTLADFSRVRHRRKNRRAPCANFPWLRK